MKGQLSFFNVSTKQLKTFNFYSIHARNGTTSFRKLKNLVSTLHVTNGERGIQVFEDYKNTLTESLEQRPMIPLCVKKSGRDRPNFRNAIVVAGFSS